ncbi:MAG: glycosyltransferase [Phycisphaerae bacterium]
MSGSSAEPRVAVISSYVPRRCGIATFSHNLSTAIACVGDRRGLGHDSHVHVVAINDVPDGYEYPGEVHLSLDQHRRDAYGDLADTINASRIQVVSLQHEFGLFGGSDGSYLLDFVEGVTKPVVPTLHTVLSEPSPGQRSVLSRVCRASERIVVMAERARSILNDVYDVPQDKIDLIHHGVPDVPYGDTEDFKDRFGLRGRPVILTFGLLSPGKCIEVMLDALAEVVPHHPDVVYVVLGITHPGVRRESGEQYRLELQSRAVQLGIERNVQFHNHYVSNEDLAEYLQAADIYVTPYRAKEQITSGTLAYAVATGKVVVSTPYWHAEELLADGRGRLFDFGDSRSLAVNLNELLENHELRQSIGQKAYAFGRQMTWSAVGQDYVNTFQKAIEQKKESVAGQTEGRQVVMRMSLPEPQLDHLYRMTDDTGMLQHAKFAVPDRAHGYCTDDNSRALIVSSLAYALFRDEEVLPFLNRYLAFMAYALPHGGGRFRNFMSYDRRWFDQDGSDDCQGRAIWSLGFLVAHAPDVSSREVGTELLRSGLAQIDTLHAPRSWALSVLGLYYFLQATGSDGAAQEALVEFSDRLYRAHQEHARADWQWFEDVVTYDNGRVPQALIFAGMSRGDQGMVDVGIESLKWLLSVQKSPEGHLSVIGNQGWMTSSGAHAKYDQQPLEAAALIEACKAAYMATQDRTWLEEMRTCFEWYVGRNDENLTLIDFRSRGCFDGLLRGQVNTNQGAESTLAWLHSLLLMHEMQDGEPARK